MVIETTTWYGPNWDRQIRRNVVVVKLLIVPSFKKIEINLLNTMHAPGI